MTDDDKTEAYRASKEAVNMPPAALEKWLATDDSRRLGWKGNDGKGDGESVGHQSGGRIVTILRAKKADLSDADYAICARWSATSAATPRRAAPRMTRRIRTGAIR